MYKFISIARYPSDVWSTSMYIYQNIDTNKYYISRMFPVSSRFLGSNLVDTTNYNLIEYPMEISNDDLNKKTIKYFGLEWKFNI